MRNINSYAVVDARRMRSGRAETCFAEVPSQEIVRKQWRERFVLRVGGKTDEGSSEQNAFKEQKEGGGDTLFPEKMRFHVFNKSKKIKKTSSRPSLEIIISRLRENARIPQGGGRSPPPWGSSAYFKQPRNSNFE